jgi:tight adherence protein C
VDAISNYFSNLNYVALISTVVFASVVCIVAAFGYWLMGLRTPVDRRLQEISTDFADEPHIEHKESGFDVTWAEPVAKLVQPSEEWKRSGLKRKLVNAGYRSQSAMTIFLAAKIILAIVVPLVLVLPVVSLGFVDSGAYEVIAVSVLLAIVGFLVPDLVVQQKMEKRQLAIMEAFPDALDLLVVCVESGLGLDGAIQKVGHELSFSWPELGDELKLVNLELRAGKDRKEALKSLAERTGISDIQALVSILIQAEHFGTSIADSLREHANEMRLARIQRAKEKAAKLPVKLLFPILFFIFPALFLVILGPAAIRIYTTLIASG